MKNRDVESGTCRFKSSWRMANIANVVIAVGSFRLVGPARTSVARVVLSKDGVMYCWFAGFL